MHKIWQDVVAANFPSNPFADTPRRTAKQKILHLTTLHCAMGIAHDRRTAKVAVWVRPNTHLSSFWRTLVRGRRLSLVSSSKSFVLETYVLQVFP